MYCTRAEAVAAGAKDVGAALDAVIAEAAERVDAFTGTHFEQWTGAEQPTLDVGQRTVALPAEASAVTLVRLLSPEQVIPASSYRVFGNLLHLAADSGSDILIAGAEPWRGGFANLFGNLDGRALEVTATFGPAVPGVVRRSTALLTALLAPTAYLGQADEEGNPVGLPPLSTTTTASAGPVPERIAPWGLDRGNAGRTEVTTGLAEVDRLLAVYRARYAARVKVG